MPFNYLDLPAQERERLFQTYGIKNIYSLTHTMSSISCVTLFFDAQEPAERLSAHLREYITNKEEVQVLPLDYAYTCCIQLRGTFDIPGSVAAYFKQYYLDQTPARFYQASAVAVELPPAPISLTHRLSPALCSDLGIDNISLQVGVDKFQRVILSCKTQVDASRLASLLYYEGGIRSRESDVPKQVFHSDMGGTWDIILWPSLLPGETQSQSDRFFQCIENWRYAYHKHMASVPSVPLSMVSEPDQSGSAASSSIQPTPIDWRALNITPTHPGQTGSDSKLPVAPQFEAAALPPVVDTLGRGTFACVDALSDRVVLKTPIDARDSNLPREADILCSIDSPFVNRGYGYLKPGPDCINGGILMERCHGQGLSNLIENATVEKMLTWLPQIARAIQDLQHAHIVHCDLNPNNIMIENDAVKIIDLGSARFMTEAGKLREPNGDLGFGVPAYMAPEFVVSRTVEDLRPYDLYTLGVTILAMIEGQKLPTLTCTDGTPIETLNTWAITFKKQENTLVVDIPLENSAGLDVLSSGLQRKYRPSEQPIIVKLLQLARQLTAFQPGERGTIAQVVEKLAEINRQYHQPHAAHLSPPAPQALVSPDVIRPQPTGVQQGYAHQFFGIGGVNNPARVVGANSRVENLLEQRYANPQ